MKNQYATNGLITKEHINILNWECDFPAPRTNKRGLIVYLIDTSVSMNGDKMIKANEAMKNTLLAVKEENGIRADLYVSIIQFNSSATLLTGNMPRYVEDYDYENLSASGCTAMGEAFRVLNNHVFTSDYMQCGTGWKSPNVILVTDGMPTDDWKAGLTELRKNSLFNEAQKIALAIGCSDEARNVLTEFTGNAELVLEADSMEEFAKAIQLVSLVSARNEIFRNSGSNGSDEDRI